MTILFLATLAACHVEEHTCPDEADMFVQMGPVVEDPCDCTNGVRMMCVGACVGASSSDFTCEDPARVAAFVNGPGREVNIGTTPYLDPGGLALVCE